MPSFKYACTKCLAREVRISGISDHLVVCTHCGHLMIRTQDMASLLASYARADSPMDQ